VRFIALAIRGGNKLNTDPSLDSLDLWLSKLKGHYPSAVESKPGSGRIVRLCEASADLCNMFESATLEEEHRFELEERRRSDPAEKNVPIPDELVREVLGELYGIKPEEFTWDKAERDQPPTPETISSQLTRLREECRWTIEHLAEKIKLDVRSVERHLAGKTKPRTAHIGAYERVFSEALGRRVVIQNMPVKRR
jgi:ribosome-binding protein aMBF1 (putative translation factor)